MIAQDSTRSMCAQETQDAERVRTAVDEVAHRFKRVIRGIEAHGVEQAFQFVEATLDVADENASHVRVLVLDGLFRSRDSIRRCAVG